MRFLCDEMLRGLGRWLRAAGYDTVQATAGIADRELMAQAQREDRLLVTRDRKLLEFRGARERVLWLPCNDMDTCARTLARRTGLDWLHRPFSRCLVCNGTLAPADPADWVRVPPRARARGGPLYHCSDCNKWYWEGSHVRRMRHCLEAWRTAAAAGRGAMQ